MSTFCDYFNQGICRSCDLMDLEYFDQVSRKENIIKEGLSSFGSFQFLPTVTSQKTQFRNKAKMSVTGSIDTPIIGLTGGTRSALDEGREILNCPIHHPRINEVLNELVSYIKLSKLHPYSIETKTGELKGFILFYSEESQEMYLRFILRSKESLDRIKKHLSLFLATFPYIKCVTANIQPIPHALLEGKEEILLAGTESINHKLKDLEFEIRPQAFVQTNQKISLRLYETASIWIKELGTQRFSELYCGQGAFSFFAAPFVQEALGIEINPEAVDAANSHAKKTGLTHLHFLQSDAALIQDVLKKFSPDTVLVNPPRRGLGTSLDYLKKDTYENLIYSSCSHETLISDLKELTNYQIERVQIFDMFPHTKHFETLVLLKDSYKNE